MIKIELPFGFYFINYLDPEPSGSESVELQTAIVDNLTSKSIHYALIRENRRQYIGFNRVRDAVYFRMKMGEWEEQFDVLSSVMAGYKGRTQIDAAMFYAPYIPLQNVRVKNPFETTGFTSRYGMTRPFAEDGE